MYSKRSKWFVSAAVVVTLLLTQVPVASAVTSDEIAAQLDSAQAELNALYEQAEQASEALNETRYQLEQTEASIADNEEQEAAKAAELDRTSAALADVVAEDYKMGRPTLAALILSASSLDELLNSIHAANKVVEHQQQVIAAVQTARAELEATREALEADRTREQELLQDQEQQVDELNSRAADAESYVANLSDELQEALAAEEAARKAEEERRAEEARLAAEAAAAEAAAQAAAQEQQQQAQSSESTSSETSSVEVSASSGNSEAASIIVNAALSQIGVAYVWGASSPGVAFDCSGLVQYCYGCAGIYVPHSSAALAAYCTKSASEAVAGDFVWRSGHVGICIGNGVTVEAFYPGRGVSYGSVSDFSRAGSPR